ncbi:MAG: phosphoribosylformylglycinamidine synthase subunit PurL [Bacillota bacterium]
MTEWQKMGLTDEEYRMIVERLGREPNYTELGMISVMWSEHCSYKNSKAVLKTLPTRGPQVLQGPGENAGIVHIGDGIGVAFKIESHNHPSAVEPYEGAATGIGGMLRDIFTMGARPIASLNALWVGDLSSEKSRWILDGAVAGIAGYGNAVGVPTVAGCIGFHRSYENNPLVNAMCVGVIRADAIKRGVAAGVGNSVMIIGSSTGRDGIHGATFASADLTDETVESKSAMQVGDPFRESALMEACLELAERGCVVGMQDMGAAGLTCSTSEMASRAGTGIEIDVALVPMREEGMTPYEVMLSESQERMLLVPVPGREQEVEAVLAKWGLHAVRIGTVTDDGMVTVKDHGSVVACLPSALLTEAPVYRRESERPAYLDDVASFDTSIVPSPNAPEGLDAALLKVLASPNVASKRWAYEQFNTGAGVATVADPGADAAVVKVPGSRRGIALTVDCNSRFCWLDPEAGAAHAVAEAARNLACSGARPLAITNCLNFGNPYKPEVFWQFERCARGMAAACEALDTPITGGNVSLSNEDGQTPIRPTPAIGMLGVLDDVSLAVPSGFVAEGDSIILLGTTCDEIGGSEYLAVVHGIEAGRIPRIDLEAERRLIDLLVAAAGARLLRSAHDVSDGGLAVALAECCMAGAIGADLAVTGSQPMPADRMLFSESGARAVVSAKPCDVELLLQLAQDMKVPATLLGSTGGNRLRVCAAGSTDAILIDLGLQEMEQAYEGALPCAMSKWPARG